LARRGRAGKQLDQARGKQSAFRRNEVRLLLVTKIIGDENLVPVVAGENEVGSFALEVGREEEVRVRNRDRRGSSAKIDATLSRASNDSDGA